MDGSELLKLLPGVIGFFTIDDFPGVILKDRQGWIFEGGATNPRPITRDEILERGGVPALADHVAELFTLTQPHALDFLKKKQSSSSQDVLDELRVRADTDLEKQEFYRPDQARGAAGTPEGGQFVPEGGGIDISAENIRGDDIDWIVRESGGNEPRYDVRTRHGRQFFSPNTTDMTFEGAQSAMKGKGQQQAKAITEHVDHQVGIEESNSFDGIGDWSDGAENSVVSEVGGFDDFDQLRYSAAIKGKLLNQKAVLAFQVGDGDDVIYDTYINSTNLQDIREQLSKAGIHFRTILPEADKTHLVIYDPGGKLESNINQVAEHYDSIVSKTGGKGEFVGESDTREGAVKNYDAIIAAYEEKFPNRGHYGKTKRQRVHDNGSEVTKIKNVSLRKKTSGQHQVKGVEQN